MALTGYSERRSLPFPWQRAYTPMTRNSVHPLTISLSVLDGRFSHGPGLASTRMSPFWILLELRMMEVVSGDNWSCKTRKAPVKMSPPTIQHPMKQVLRETQAMCAGCSKAEPKNFCPAADTLPGGAGRPKFNQQEMVTTFTYKPSLVKIDACNFELSQ